ncbi:MAG: GGDEF domain-containing protein [Saccharofermentans sp.]|nr:GGDEF domain-containing protein [Saccharofermentans sp.]
MKDQRLKIAVFTSKIYEAMIQEIQTGINKAAAELGCKIIYFCSFSDNFSSKYYDHYGNYDIGDTVCFDIPDLSKFDAVIRIDASYSEYVLDKIDEILSDLPIPVINVGGKRDGYLNIHNDEKASFRLIVEHLIKEHGCREIFHVAGKPDKYYTRERIEAFREELEANGIPFDSDKVFYGNLWKTCGDEAVDRMLEVYKGKLPDAIVCANDYMALGVASACRARGIDIPGDVLLTGFDGIEAASQGFPSITTLAQPFEQMGYQSVYLLLDMIGGKKVEGDIRIPGEVIRNQTCGCKALSASNVDDVREIYLTRIGKICYLSQSTTNLILGTTNCNTVDQCFEEIAKNAAVDTGLDALYLCLIPEWDKQFTVGSNYSSTDCEMTVVAGFDGDRKVERSTFRKKDILPRELLEDDKPYYIFVLHHLQYYMGYMIVRPETKWFEQLAVKSWLVNVANMLEFLRIRSELNVTVERLENISQRDSLTGLYNRRGYEMYFEEYYEACKENKSNLCVMLIDMDDLKKTNDQRGHAEGDYCICTIAEALKAASKHSEICMRSGGDEFVVLAKDYSPELAQSYKDAFETYLKEKPLKDGKDYVIGASCGVFMEVPSANSEMPVTELCEKFLLKADSFMYEEKKRHKNKN